MPGKANIFIIGAGDKGTTVASRIFRSGFRPVLLEQQHPSDLHSFRNFSDVVYLGKKEIEGISCVLLDFSSDIATMSGELNHLKNDRTIPLVKLSGLEQLADLNPEIVIDCRDCTRTDNDFEWSDFPCVIRIGPAYRVGRDGHFIIGCGGEELGKVYRKPSELKHNFSEAQYVSKAPLEGVFFTYKNVGDMLSEKEIVGQLNDINILAPRRGIITGLLHSGHFVQSGRPLFEIKPKNHANIHSIQTPVASLAIAGGVLEAVLAFISENRSIL